MTKNTFGVLVGALLMGGEKWKSMPPDVQKLVAEEVNKNRAEDKTEIRASDERSYQAMLKRGYTANEWTGAALTEYQTVADTVQKRLVGRMYTQQMLDKEVTKRPRREAKTPAARKGAGVLLFAALTRRARRARRRPRETLRRARPCLVRARSDRAGPA
jgi:hypothetical protein